MAKRKKKKIPLRVQIRRAEKGADRALSLYVRAITIKEYGHCPLCGINSVQCLFHIISRVRKSVRWDIRNVIGGCSSCNLIEQFLPDWSRYWYLKRYGLAQYFLVVEEARKDFNPTIEYLENIIKVYTDKLKEIIDGAKI